MRKKKYIDVCVLCHSYYPWDPRVRREAECLVEEGYTAEIFCLRDNNEAPVEIVNGIKIYRLPIGRHQGSNLIVYLAEYIGFLILSALVLTFHYFRKQYKIIHIHTPPDFLVCAALVPSILGAKIILDIHDVMPEFFASKKNLKMDSLLISFVGWIERISIKFADHVLTAAPAFKEAIVNRGTPKEKVDVLMNAANERIFDLNCHSRLQNHTSRNLKLIYHGSLNSQYDFKVLLDAVKILRDKIKDIELNIYGNGFKAEEIRNLIFLYSLDAHVHLNGYVPQEIIPQHIISHDFGIVPMSQIGFTDIAFPTRLFEYVAMKCPVIASRRRSIESCFDDSCIMFFKPSDSEELAKCIEELYLEPERAKLLAANALKAYEPYRWLSAKAKYCKLVNKLCNKSD